MKIKVIKILTFIKINFSLKIFFFMFMIVSIKINTKSFRTKVLRHVLKIFIVLLAYYYNNGMGNFMKYFFLIC